MTGITMRQSLERRRPDRRSFEFSSFTAKNRRTVSRRYILDRRDDPFWRFSWLRTTVSPYLTC